MPPSNDNMRDYFESTKQVTISVSPKQHHYGINLSKPGLYTLHLRLYIISPLHARLLQQKTCLEIPPALNLVLCQQ